MSMIQRMTGDSKCPPAARSASSRMKRVAPITNPVMSEEIAPEPFRRGHCPITINYQNQTAAGDIELGEDWRVNLDEHLLASLREWLKPENVQVIY